MADFLYPVPSNPPDDPADWVVAFNVEWLPIVIDAVDNLLHDYLFEGMPSDASQQVEQLILMLCTPYECDPPVASSKRTTLLHQDSIVISGNPISFLANSSQALNGVWRQNTAASGDKWSTGFNAPPGNYVIRIVCTKSSGAGDLDTYLDGTIVDHFVMYNASTQTNIVHDIFVTIANDGYHVIRGEVITKSASSSGYVCNITTISILPNGSD